MTSFIKHSQELLAKNGFAIKADGKDSKAFRAALSKFQTQEGLRQTGTVTEETLNALHSHNVPLPRPRPEFVAAATGKSHYPGREKFVVGDPGGLIEDGNINLQNRPVVKNPDGSISTVESASFNMDGREILIPTISPEGKHLSDKEALQLYSDTGMHLGIFDGPANADAYAVRLHLQQAAYYTGGHQQKDEPAPGTPAEFPQKDAPVQDARPFQSGDKEWDPIAASTVSRNARFAAAQDAAFPAPEATNLPLRPAQDVLLPNAFSSRFGEISTSGSPTSGGNFTASGGPPAKTLRPKKPLPKYDYSTPKPRAPDAISLMLQAAQGIASMSGARTYGPRK